MAQIPYAKNKSGSVLLLRTFWLDLRAMLVVVLLVDWAVSIFALVKHSLRRYTTQQVVKS